MPQRLIPILTLILILLAGITPQDAVGRAKTDAVKLRNGDYLSCEIKSMSRAKMTAKTDAMGTVDIEWLEVVALKSEFYYRVEASNGKRYFGALEIVEGSSTLRVESMGAVVALEIVNVVEITPIRRSFWDKIDGSLKVGYSYTRASQVAQFSLDWSSKYVAEKNQFDLGLSSIVTDKSDSTGITRRYDLTFGYTRLLKKKWVGTASIHPSRNDELQLKRRVLITVTTGFAPIKNYHDILLCSAGFASNLEISTDGTETESLEGVLSMSFSRFIYNTPKTNISTVGDFYPSLTEKGRYRFSFDISLRKEIVSDLFFDLSYYLDYDNQGAAGAGIERDYGITTSVGWTY